MINSMVLLYLNEDSSKSGLKEHFSKHGSKYIGALGIVGVPIAISYLLKTSMADAKPNDSFNQNPLPKKELNDLPLFRIPKNIPENKMKAVPYGNPLLPGLPNRSPDDAPMLFKNRHNQFKYWA